MHLRLFDFGIGANQDLSLRVSVAVLVKVLVNNPDDGALMLALERKANLYEVAEESTVEVKVQPFGGAVRISDDVSVSRRVLDLVAEVPTATWGRDELGTGDMWNSNSLVSWLLASAGITLDGIQPPDGGRAPGWAAGLAVACSDSG